MARRVLVGEREGTGETQRVYWDQVCTVEIEAMGTHDVLYVRITKAEAMRLLRLHGYTFGQLVAQIYPIAPGYEVILCKVAER